MRSLRRFDAVAGPWLLRVPTARAAVGFAMTTRGLMLETDVPVAETDDMQTMIDEARRGTYVEARTIAGAQAAYNLMLHHGEKENVHRDYRAFVEHIDKMHDFGKRLVLRRDFATYPDYANHETFRTDGPQRQLFDNYKWTTELASEFHVFVERFYPQRDHSHVEYPTYVRLLQSFRTEKLGRRFSPVLPKWMPLRPLHGVFAPTKAMMRPFAMYHDWLRSFVRPLGIRKALVCRAGCGLAAFTTRLTGVPMVCATDPRPLAVESMMRDRKAHEHALARMSLSTAPWLPPEGGEFDLVTVAIGAPSFDPDSGLVDYAYAPGATGLRGTLEEMFETVGAAMKPGAVLVILFSNVHQLAEPDQPHPIEHELRANRRFVLFDQMSERMDDRAAANDDIAAGMRVPIKGLRAELWVLHKLEDLPHFGWIHGVPGAKVPDHIAMRHTRKTMARERLRLMKQRVEERGEDWETYQTRLLQVMAETPDPEDHVAMAVRAKLDPHYAEEMAQKSKKTILAMLAARDEEMQRIAALPVSPRDSYDSAFGSAAATDAAAASETPSAVGDAPTPDASKTGKKKTKKKKSKRRSVDVPIETSA